MLLVMIMTRIAFGPWIKILSGPKKKRRHLIRDFILLDLLEEGGKRNV